MGSPHSSSTTALRTSMEKVCRRWLWLSASHHSIFSLPLKSSSKVSLPPYLPQILTKPSNHALGSGHIVENMFVFLSFAGVVFCVLVTLTSIKRDPRAT